MSMLFIFCLLVLSLSKHACVFAVTIIAVQVIYILYFKNSPVSIFHFWLSSKWPVTVLQYSIQLECLNLLEHSSFLTAYFPKALYQFRASPAVVLPVRPCLSLVSAWRSTWEAADWCCKARAGSQRPDVCAGSDSRFFWLSCLLS